MFLRPQQACPLALLIDLRVKVKLLHEVGRVPFWAMKFLSIQVVDSPLVSRLYDSYGFPVVIRCGFSSRGLP